MVSQCANPACGAQFLYFGEGQLITVRRHEQHAGSAIEFFWLCGDYVMRLSLEVGPDGSVNLAPRHLEPSSSPGPLKQVSYELR